MKVPFSIYDFFGYLAAGAIVMFAWAIASNAPWLSGEMSVVVSVGGVLLAYLLGHVLASISSWVFERQVVRQILGPSEEILLNERQLSKPWSSILPAYGRALPEDIRKAVIAKAQIEGINSGGRALFLHCLSTVRCYSGTTERLATFLNLYGFSRNAALASFISGAIFLNALSRSHCCCTQHEHTDMFWWSVLSIIVGIFLFFRYLKFYRHYTQEVFLSYHISHEPR